MAIALQMVHDTDPKSAILADISPHLDKIKVLGARILVAVYVPPEKTQGGIILTQKYTGEAAYQGKVGLVLETGPLAFEDDDTHRFGNVVPQVGDWIVYSVGDTFGMELGKRRVRTVEDVDVHLIIQHPDMIY